MPTPLRPMGGRQGGGDDDEEGPTSPEALLISAFINSGQFNPEEYHVSSDDIAGWGKLWAFCREYQQKAGAAPSPLLVSKMFPEFVIMPDVNTAWAADKVRVAASMRDLRFRSRAILAALNDEDLEGAFGAIEGAVRPRGHRKEPISVFDHSSITEEFQVTRIEVPFQTLQRASKGGIGPGEFWVVAARLGQGKTHVGLEFLARAAKIGYRCAVGAYEMPAKQVNARLIRKLAGRDSDMLKLLDSEEERDRKKAIDAIKERVPGTVEVFDPSHGRINTVGFATELCRDYDLVMLDHLGLMQNNEGKRAIDDWRIQSWISNSLREVTLSTETPVLALAQVNRQGEHSGSNKPPKASELSQADAIGQDADVVITMKRPSKRLMRYEAVKLREGPNVGWFTRFEPERNRFEEISKEIAREIEINDVAAEDF